MYIRVNLTLRPQVVTIRLWRRTNLRKFPIWRSNYLHRIVFQGFTYKLHILKQKKWN